MSEEYQIPDHRCGFELKPDDEGINSANELDKWHGETKAVCCWREIWRNTDRCIWHAEVKEKPIEELKAARADKPERLDGALLLDVKGGGNFGVYGCGLRSAGFWHVDLSGVNFQGADLTNAEFHGAKFTGANFHDAELSRVEFRGGDLTGANFHGTELFDTKFYGTNLTAANFHDTKLSETLFYRAFLLATEFHNAYFLSAQFHNAELTEAEFHDADFLGVEFHGSSLVDAKFHSTYLEYAEFCDTRLYRTEFHDADFSGDDPPPFSDKPDLPDFSSVKFHDADLRHAEFHNANLTGVEFYDANLSNADCTDAEAIDTDFTHTPLHDTLLTRADCRGATFTSALLYETVFADTRINSQTTFHDPEATFYDSIRSRPAVVYEENPITAEDLPEDTHPLEAAEWVYRRLEKLHDENALSEEARDFHISKKEAQRKYQRESGEYTRYIVSTLQWYLTGHGESIARIFGSAAYLILACGILYPFVGGFESTSTGTAYRINPLLTEFSRTAILDGIAIFLQSIYFSVITFTTIGYGDLYPTGAGSKVLVGFESLSGAILIALFVFVLGRRVAR